MYAARFAAARQRARNRIRARNIGREFGQVRFGILERGLGFGRFEQRPRRRHGPGVCDVFGAALDAHGDVDGNVRQAARAHRDCNIRFADLRIGDDFESACDSVRVIAIHGDRNDMDDGAGWRGRRLLRRGRSDCRCGRGERDNRKRNGENGNDARGNRDNFPTRHWFASNSTCEVSKPLYALCPRVKELYPSPLSAVQNTRHAFTSS